MKKGLIIIAAALFVAAMVLPAMAVDMSLSGYYRVRGFYQSNADQGQVTPWEGTNPYGGANAYGSPEAWWDHHLQLNPVFKVADNLKLVTRVSAFNNQMFGSGSTSGAITTKNSATGSDFATFNDPDGADNIIFNRAYIEWATPKGTLKIGRQDAGTTFLPFANSERDGDRIRYNSPTWSGFNFSAYYEKLTESSVTSGHNIGDEDKDSYVLRLNYAQPCWWLGYGLDFVRDRTSSSGIAIPPYAAYKADYFLHHVALKANDPTNTYFFEGELQLQAGDYKDYYGATADIDRKGWGYYAAVGMKKAPLTVALATAFTSGDDNAADDYKVGPAFGLDFQPLYIATGPYSNILTSQSGTSGGAMSDTALSGLPSATRCNTGAKAYVLSADYQCSPELALHGALGAAYADKVGAGVDDEFGTEFDLGLKYQIMSNLAYELHFGYLWTGDFFKGPAGKYTTDDIYQIDHSLTLSF
ncbi:MAG: hypothetical protein Q8O04_00855 [Deltaproteobacteria bacterium]|nr:hypothetical protein [Deltaproteobacteria bacterium]